LHGHTHLPVAFLVEDGRVEVVSPGDGSVLELRGRQALVNPGSVGQPRDGDPRSSYLVLDTAADTVTWHRIAYDIESVQEAMQAAGLPAWLVNRLGVGL
jgi:diadenosine tetraphosphatase ApaH/serine/threonine PP2A family protein phosphatase